MMMRHGRSLLFLVAAALLATAGTLCFLIQGGFGGGHGDLDRVLFVLALPWSALPWPEPLVDVDFLWLVLLPFALNVTSIAVITYAVNRLRRNRA